MLAILLLGRYRTETWGLRFIDNLMMFVNLAF